MTKRELVIEVADRLGFTQNEVASVVQVTLDAISESLAEGRRLEIRNFGVFEIKSRDSRMGRNPRTGQEVPIAEKRVASFKPGKALKELVQSGQFVSEGPSESFEDVPAGPVEEAEVPRQEQPTSVETGSGEQGQLF